MQPINTIALGERFSRQHVSVEMRGVHRILLKLAVIPTVMADHIPSGASNWFDKL